MYRNNIFDFRLIEKIHRDQPQTSVYISHSTAFRILGKRLIESIKKGDRVRISETAFISYKED